ncbi:MAG: hypothetical protein WCD70_04435 [Alphaproteobacteria bacterium]
MEEHKPTVPDTKPVDATPIAVSSKPGHEARLVPTGMAGDHITYARDENSISQTRAKILGLNTPADVLKMEQVRKSTLLPNGKTNNAALAKMTPRVPHRGNMQQLKNQAETKAMLDELDGAPREASLATGKAKHAVAKPPKKNWALHDGSAGFM